ncbi:MAG: type VI secretion system baseplate subunit TssE [Planctomycetota bacterium]|jgi:type VI secretion system protein
MGREQTLLARIAGRAGPNRGRYEPTASEDLEALMDSVRGHLTRLLNARHGMSQALPDYGLPAMSDLTVGGGDYLQAVQAAIQTTIEKYEPRLRRVRVTPVVDEEIEQRTLTFRVDAVLISQTGEHRVWYETQVSGDGDFEVSA